MQPAYYEDFIEIKKKIWLMLDDAVKNRASQFRIPTFICGNDNNIDGRIVVLSCLLYTSPSPRDTVTSRMPSSA